MALVCLATGATVVRLAAAITLAWTHSVQKSAWQEDWRATSDGLMLTEVRVQGSGAGMEPPEGAVLKGGFYVAHPTLAPQREVILRRSGATADWQVCIAGTCHSMAELVPPDADPVTLTICE
ncbi:DUF1850 domain-containing protein [Xanthobacter aminoxidans]|uniref:DUF1850 domain-containing protein n=1 Tax=Xanthobacter aminoxidans TaxID=186280 RepID=UPI002022F4BA